MSYSLPYTGLETEELLNNVPNDSTLATLTTTNKTIVGAINEVDAEITENKYESTDNEGQVIPLHTSTVAGNLDVTLKGKTYTNMVVNGDFEDGTTGWIATYSSLSSSNNILSIEGDGSNNSPAARQNTSKAFVVGNKIYVTAKARAINPDCTQIKVAIYGTTATGTLQYLPVVNNPTQNTWYQISGVVTLPSNGAGNIVIRFYFVYPDAATASGKVTDIDGNYGVTTIDLTAANETETDLNILAAKYPFVNGTKSVSPQKISSVGKNLINGELTNTYISANIAPNQQYNLHFASVSNATSWRIRYQFYRNGVNVSNSIVVANFTRTGYVSGGDSWLWSVNDTVLSDGFVNIDADRVDIKLDVGDVTENSITVDAQLELGSTATTHEPYKETHLYTTDELAGLPNGVRDEFNLLSGEKVQRVKEYVVTADDVTAFNNTSFTNDYATIVSTNFSDISDFTINIDNFIMLAGLSQMENISENYNNVSKAGMYATVTTGQTVAITSLAGTYADLAAAKVGLAGTVIYYETTEPITIQLPPQLLKSEKSGTLYVEQKIEDFGFYGSNFIILDTDYPITSLTEVVKVDTQTGEETTLALDNCTIAGDGLSFTSTDLASDDFVRCEFEYTPAGAPPTVDYIVSTTLKGQVNDNSDGVKYLNKKVVSNELEVATKANKTQEDWIEPTLLNGWVNFGSGTFRDVGYYKDEFGIVHLGGVIKNGIITSGTELFVLPAGYRPSASLVISLVSNAVFGYIVILSSGEVETRLVATQYVTFDNISFRAEA